MMPSKLIKLMLMPHNANGKIDRKKLKEMLDIRQLAQEIFDQEKKENGGSS